MTSAVVYDGVSGNFEANGNAQLFSGFKLWFSHSVPSREWFITNAKANGATIVPLEKQADILLVDHARKNQAPGTHSYKFIEQSIRNGKLEDLATHAVGVPSRVNRPVGSIITAPKRSRTPFTDADDQILWNWIVPFQEAGGAVAGNEIYKQLENRMPHHTYQSWRDRWLKITRLQMRRVTETIWAPIEVEVTDGIGQSQQSPGQRRQGGLANAQQGQTPEKKGEEKLKTPVSTRNVMSSPSKETGKKRARPDSDSNVNSPATPMSRQKQPRTEKTPDQLDNGAAQFRNTFTSINSIRQPHHKEPSDPKNPFTTDETKKLYGAARQIIVTEPTMIDKSWEDLAANRPQHTAQEWRSHFEKVVLPVYCARHSIEMSDVRSVLLQNSQDDDQDGAEDAEDDLSEIRSSPGLVTCVHCHTIESTGKWFYNKEGKPLCSNCRQLLRSHRGPQPSPIWTNPPAKDAEEGEEEKEKGKGIRASGDEALTAPVVEKLANVTPGDLKLKETPASHETISVGLNRPPEPNEARKRSAGQNSQSNSQNSNSSGEPLQNLGQLVDGQTSQTKKRKGFLQPTSDIDVHTVVANAETGVENVEIKMQSPKRKKKTLLRDEPLNLEVPSSPELTLPGTSLSHLSEDEDEQGSPTPRGPRSSIRNQKQMSKSPRLKTHDEATDELRTPTRKQRSPGNHLQSTPLVHLFSEADSKKNSSPPEVQISESSDAGSDASLAEYFETAPDVSNVWETAPDQYEELSTGSEIEVQTLLPQSQTSNTLLDDFALPDPEGGWDTIEMSQPEKVEQQKGSNTEPGQERKQMTSTTEEKSRSPSEPVQIDSWLVSQTALYPSCTNLASILDAAITATSFDYDLAASVVKTVILEQEQHHAGRKSNPGEASNFKLPQDMKGCWTVEDDESLMGSNGREMDRVQRKHGSDNLNRRFEFLEMWMKAK